MVTVAGCRRCWVEKVKGVIRYIRIFVAAKRVLEFKPPVLLRFPVIVLFRVRRFDYCNKQRLFAKRAKYFLEEWILFIHFEGNF